jgi:hypothetical protein
MAVDTLCLRRSGSGNDHFEQVKLVILFINLFKRPTI